MGAQVQLTARFQQLLVVGNDHGRRFLGKQVMRRASHHLGPDEPVEFFRGAIEQQIFKGPGVLDHDD